LPSDQWRIYNLGGQEQPALEAPPHYYAKLESYRLKHGNDHAMHPTGRYKEA
jgi:hypothetical protein